MVGASWGEWNKLDRENASAGLGIDTPDMKDSALVLYRWIVRFCTMRRGRSSHPPKPVFDIRNVIAHPSRANGLSSLFFLQPVRLELDA